MYTTSINARVRPRRTAALVGLVAASLTVTTTGTGLVVAGPVSAQPLPISSAPALHDRPSSIELSSSVPRDTSQRRFSYPGAGTAMREAALAVVPRPAGMAASARPDAPAGQPRSPFPVGRAPPAPQPKVPRRS
jgi:hypothetical protein